MLGSWVETGDILVGKLTPQRERIVICSGEKIGLYGPYPSHYVSLQKSKNYL
ncbi:hypothetical protein Pint_33789 [Pistacia integerrima]|uniref:Uncharacterized protein n=1 Tax=Pistacia integerrima TaxID=434235 RepID=A0ACC0X500_9ROSI|nr:hypothetical protein Pint_33789 [Pistacia integerrima]